MIFKVGEVHIHPKKGRAKVVTEEDWCKCYNMKTGDTYATHYTYIEWLDVVSTKPYVTTYGTNIQDEGFRLSTPLDELL